VIAENLSEEEIAGLKEMFKMMDTDNSGQINYEELKAGLERVGANMKESEISQLMQAVSFLFTHPTHFSIQLECLTGKSFRQTCDETFFVGFILQADIDNSGTIDYGEFIAATLHLNKVEREDHLYAAFQYFDKDGSGYITADELQQACDEFGIEDVRLEDMIGEVDQDNVRSSDEQSHIFNVLSNNMTSRANEGSSTVLNLTIFFENFSTGWAHRLQRVRGHDAKIHRRVRQKGPSQP
jgi:calcium-dependent protein kinase